MLDTMIKYAPIAGALFLVFLFGMWMKSRRKAALLSSVATQPLPSLAAAPAPVAQVLAPRVEHRGSRPRSLAERYEEWGSDAITIEDAQEQSFMALVALDKEQERRANLMAAARKYSKDNALKGAYLDNRTGAGFGATGPN